MNDKLRLLILLAEECLIKKDLSERKLLLAQMKDLIEDLENE